MQKQETAQRDASDEPFALWTAGVVHLDSQLLQKAWGSEKHDHLPRSAMQPTGVGN